jgi:hypothetical protein
MYALNGICPYCQTGFELKLESKPDMMLMICPECSEPLLYFHDGFYKVDQVEFMNFAKNQMDAIEGFVRISKESGLESEKESQVKPVSRILHVPGEPVRDDELKKDDILNLIIDLESSGDVDEFLKKI